LAIPCIYEDAFWFSEGLSKVKLNNRHGFIDKTGKLIIPCIYEYVDWFRNGLAMVEIKGRFGYINKEGIEYWED
jgi:hypothetical protein